MIVCVCDEVVREDEDRMKERRRGDLLYTWS